MAFWSRQMPCWARPGTFHPGVVVGAGTESCSLLCSVMRWRDARRRGGSGALRVRFSPGRPLKLDAAERKRLVRLLLKGSTAYGYRTNLWTTARIAELVEREFGVRYHRDHVGRLMHSLGWSAQKPERRALERDEKEIARWKQKEWPRIKKTLRGWAPT